MEIIKNNGSQYIDQELNDYISNIWATFKNATIPDGTNIYFLKNATIPRIVTDYSGTDIRRVIKKEKAHYAILKQFRLSNYPYFYDKATGSVHDNNDDNETRTPVYTISNHTLETKLTIESILDFITRGQAISYIDEVKVNESLNNGFVLSKESYTSVQELVNSDSVSNKELAYNMIANSDLKSNWQWLVYIYFDRSYDLNNHDKNGKIGNYIKGETGVSFNSLTESVDKAMKYITDEDVREGLVSKVREKFNSEIASFLKHSIGATNFKLDDFKLNYYEDK